MKKFLYKLSVYVLILSLITLGINMIYIREMEKVFGSKFRDQEIDNIPDNIQICNFGSSHGQHGFNYEDAAAKYTCFNFALSSQSLLYDYKILLAYKDKLNENAVVFIPVSYFSLFGEPEHKEKTFASRNKRYYKFLPKELITAYDWKTDMYINCLPALFPDSLTMLAKIFLHLKLDKADDTDRKLDPASINDNAMKAYERHIAGKFEADGIRMRKLEAFDAIRRMISLCREICARPVMVTVPYLSEYTDTVRNNDPEFFGDFYAAIREIISDTGCEYYDYAFDERFCKDYSLFFDPDHLNRKGARKFTDILLIEALSIDVMPPE